MLGQETVRNWMSPKVIGVAPDASLREVCQTMASDGVHRVLVVEGRRLLGIVTSFDVVRLLAKEL